MDTPSDPQKPVTVGLTSELVKHPLLYQKFQRWCYGQKDHLSPVLSWSICGEYEFRTHDRLTPLQVTAGKGKHSHLGQAMVIVRVTNVGGLPVASWWVVGTSLHGYTVPELSAPPVLPDEAGLGLGITQWAEFRWAECHLPGGDDHAQPRPSDGTGQARQTWWGDNKTPALPGD